MASGEQVMLGTPPGGVVEVVRAHQERGAGLAARVYHGLGIPLRRREGLLDRIARFPAATLARI